MPKIGYLAVSGVRCNDTELLELGLNLPGFVERSEVIASLPSLGLLTLAGLTPDVFEHEYVEIPDPDNFDTSKWDFDMVAISSFSAKIKEAYALAQSFRKKGTHVVMGGLHVTALAHEAKKYADTIILGEAESRWVEFLTDWWRGEAKDVYDCRERVFSLADAPIPAFELLDISKYNRLTVQTQRGCPWQCEFCASSRLLSQKFRTKPVKNVIAEIQAIKSIWQNPFIEFADDNTFANKKKGKQLAKAMTKENVRWFTETDISVADDSELLSLLADSGCAQLLIGLESPDKKVLRGLERRSNWKQKKYDYYMDSISRIQQAGITVNGCFILGLDGSDTGSFDRTFEFIKDSGLFEAQITVMTPFPGTRLYDRLVKQGRIIDEGAWEKCTLFDINFKPDSMSVQELRTGLMILGGRVYDEKFIKERRKNFFLARKAVRQQLCQQMKSA